MMTEEDEAFNEIERRSVAKKDAVKAQLDKPQRTWVGLTDEEMLSIEETTTCTKDESWLRNVTRAIEAKLKEKNT
jgi:hypothetical protein